MTTPGSCGPGMNIKWHFSLIVLNWRIKFVSLLKPFVKFRKFLNNLFKIINQFKISQPFISSFLRPYLGCDRKLPHITKAYGGQSEYPMNKVWSFSNTYISHRSIYISYSKSMVPILMNNILTLSESSQTSAKKTIIVSTVHWAWLKAIDDLQLMSVGPPK